MHIFKVLVDVRDRKKSNDGSIHMKAVFAASKFRELENINSYRHYSFRRLRTMTKVF